MLEAFMSCSSIKNVGRMVDVRQALELNALDASNEAAPRGGLASIRFMPTTQANASRSAVTAGDDSTAVNSLVALFTSFFTQLINLISDK